MKHTKSFAVISAAVAAMLALAGCGSADPFAGSDAKENAAKDADVIVVGSANFSESEIIARIYAEALKDNGIDAFYIQRFVADEHGIETIGDLKKLGDDLEVAAPPEFSKRVYGIEGLRSKYGLTVSLVPVNDGGGQSTVRALLDGQVDFARLDSTSPLIAANDLVRLEDDREMILAQNIVPVVRTGRLDDKAKAVIDKVQAKLTTEDLMDMNARSVNDKKSAQDIAEDWLDEADLF